MQKKAADFGTGRSERYTGGGGGGQRNEVV